MTKERMTLQVLSLAGLVACVILALWGWRTGVLTSQEQMQALVHSCGAVGIVLFILFQAVQVVVPVLPGGIGCLAGVLILDQCGALSITMSGSASVLWRPLRWRVTAANPF